MLYNIYKQLLNSTITKTYLFIIIKIYIVSTSDNQVISSDVVCVTTYTVYGSHFFKFR